MTDKRGVKRGVESIDTESDFETARSMLNRAHLNTASWPTGESGAGAVSGRKPVMTANPAVTVVVPVFNEAAYVTAAIDSLKGQTFADFEAVVVDDASTDLSMREVMRAIGDDSRFRIARHAANAGLSAARNTGLRLAKGGVICFLDADDMYFPDALEVGFRRLRKMLRKSVLSPRLAGVYLGTATCPQRMTLDGMIVEIADREHDGPIFDFVNTLGDCPFNAHAPLLRTSVVRAHGGFDETFRHGCEDWDLWQRIMRSGYVFAPVGVIGAVYRQKRGSMVRSMPTEHLATAQRLFDRAHAPMDPDLVSAGAPFVFEMGVDKYQTDYRFARRVIQFTAINCFVSREAIEDSLALLPDGARFKEADVRDIAEAGVNRTLALDMERAPDDIRESVATVSGKIASEVMRRLAPRQERPAPRPPVDAVFLPQTQAQVPAMESVARRLEAAGLSTLFVTTEAETGDQGQQAAIERAGLPHLSFSRLCLKEIQAKTFVITRPYTALIRDAIPEGAAIFELERTDRPISHPDENQPRSDVRICNADEAEAAIMALRTEAAPCSLREGVKPNDLAPAVFAIGKEEAFGQAADYEKLAALKDRWKGQRCVIIGNGPSINTTDLSKLANDFTFAVNGIFYKRAEMGFDPTFYVVEDSSVMKENIDAIKAYKAQHKFFPTQYRSLHPAEENTAFFLMNRGFYERESPAWCIPRFSVDAARRVYCGQSVTHINLQLAYYFGFAEVYLIGVDFSYVIPDSAIRKGDLIVSTESDPNHFHPDYFGKGKSWKDPKLHRVRLNYELARDMFEADGRKIWNATKGGALDVFDRVDYDDVFGDSRRDSAKRAT